jgi:hypothetical protein
MLWDRLANLLSIFFNYQQLTFFLNVNQYYDNVFLPKQQ